MKIYVRCACKSPLLICEIPYTCKIPLLMVHSFVLFLLCICLHAGIALDLEVLIKKGQIKAQLLRRRRTKEGWWPGNWTDGRTERTHTQVSSNESVRVYEFRAHCTFSAHFMLDSAHCVHFFHTDAVELREESVCAFPNVRLCCCTAAWEFPASNARGPEATHCWVSWGRSTSVSANFKVTLKPT